MSSCTKEQLKKAKDTRGFLLLIYQGASHAKTYMQKAEAEQASWLSIPRIGVSSMESLDICAGNADARKLMQLAKRKAAEQWLHGIKQDVELVSERFEALSGSELKLDSRGYVQGRARCIFPNGCIHEGEFQESKPHGNGKRIHLDQSFDLNFYVKGIASGPGIRWSSSRYNAWMLHDGQIVEELSPNVATQKSQDLQLSEC